MAAELGGEARPGLDGDVAREQGRAALRADDLRMGDLAAPPVAQQHRSPPAPVEPPVAPHDDGGQHRIEVAPLRGQPVLEALRSILVLAPLEETLRHEPAEALGEDVASDPERGLEFVEAANAVERFTQHEWRPPVAEKIDGAGDRTGPLREGSPPHRDHSSQLHY